MPTRRGDNLKSQGSTSPTYPPPHTLMDFEKETRSHFYTVHMGLKMRR